MLLCCTVKQSTVDRSIDTQKNVFAFLACLLFAVGNKKILLPPTCPLPPIVITHKQKVNDGEVKGKEGESCKQLFLHAFLLSDFMSALINSQGYSCYLTSRLVKVLQSLIPPWIFCFILFGVCVWGDWEAGWLSWRPSSNTHGSSLVYTQRTPLWQVTTEEKLVSGFVEEFWTAQPL